jgi:hypothetical protein
MHVEGIVKDMLRSALLLRRKIYRALLLLTRAKITECDVVA